MDKEFIMATAKTIEQQILWSINKWEYLSWGISKKVAIEYEGMATLALRVSGAVHKGWVFISLNDGMDCYEVRLLNVARNKVKRTLEEVYCDNLGEVLDGLIERKTEWTDEQYKNKAARDSAKKMGVDVVGISKDKSKTGKTMAKSEVKFRPATMAEIEGRDTDLYMDGEQVWVMMIHRSETIGEGEPKLDYIMLTNMKKVQVEDLQVIDNNNNEPEEDKTMATVEMNETKNVQNNAQVNNETIDVNVGEVTVDSIMPVMQPVEGAPTKQEVAEAICKAANEGKATTMPLSEHGTLVIAGVGSDKPKKPRGIMPKVTLKTKTPQVQDSVPQASGAYRVVLVPSKDGSGQWPKLYGFQSEADAEKITKKMAKSIRNSWDRDEQGEKRFYIKAGKKYCDVFQELCNALNAGDKAAIDKACKRTVAIYDGAVADGKAESAAKKSEREVAKAQEKPAVKPSVKAEKPAAPATPAMSDEDAAMFELFKRFMAGDKEAMAKVGAVLNKAA